MFLNSGMFVYFSKWVWMIPAIAENANGSMTSVVGTGISIKAREVGNATQKLVHHMQVQRYPNCVEGGCLRQIRSRSGARS